MILRGSTPPVLGRSAGLALLALAVFLLPLVPGWGHGQEAEEQKDVIRYRAQVDDLKRLEDELKRKMAEIENLKKKIEDAHKSRVEKTIKAQDVLKKRLGESRGRAVEVHKGGPVIRIEISGIGGKPEDIEKLVEKLKAALPEKDRKVIILRSGSQGTYERYVAPWVEMGRRNVPHVEVIPPRVTVRPKATVPVLPPSPAVPPGDRRIDGLEKKLDSVLRELEALRKELRGPARPGATPSRRFGGGGSGSGRGPEGGNTEDTDRPGGLTPPGRGPAGGPGTSPPRP